MSGQACFQPAFVLWVSAASLVGLESSQAIHQSTNESRRSRRCPNRLEMCWRRSGAHSERCRPAVAWSLLRGCQCTRIQLAALGFVAFAGHQSWEFVAMLLEELALYDDIAAGSCRGCAGKPGIAALPQHLPRGSTSAKSRDAAPPAVAADSRLRVFAPCLVGGTLIMLPMYFVVDPPWTEVAGSRLRSSRRRIG